MKTKVKIAGSIVGIILLMAICGTIYLIINFKETWMFLAGISVFGISIWSAVVLGEYWAEKELENEKNGFATTLKR